MPAWHRPTREAAAPLFSTVLPPWRPTGQRSRQQPTTGPCHERTCAPDSAPPPLLSEANRQWLEAKQAGSAHNTLGGLGGPAERPPHPLQSITTKRATSGWLWRGAAAASAQRPRRDPPLKVASCPRRMVGRSEQASCLGFQPARRLSCSSIVFINNDLCLRDRRLLAWPLLACVTVTRQHGCHPQPSSQQRLEHSALSPFLSSVLCWLCCLTLELSTPCTHQAEQSVRLRAGKARR